MTMSPKSMPNDECNKNHELLQQQIDDLQSRVSHQEDLLHSLNDVIAKQDAAISSLRSKLQQNQEKLSDVAYSLESSSIEKPPHY